MVLKPLPGFVVGRPSCTKGHLGEAYWLIYRLVGLHLPRPYGLCRKIPVAASTRTLGPLVGCEPFVTARQEQAGFCYTAPIKPRLVGLTTTRAVGSRSVHWVR